MKGRCASMPPPPPPRVALSYFTFNTLRQRLESFAVGLDHGDGLVAGLAGLDVRNGAVLALVRATNDLGDS